MAGVYTGGAFGYYEDEDGEYDDDNDEWDDVTPDAPPTQVLTAASAGTPDPATAPVVSVPVSMPSAPTEIKVNVTKKQRAPSRRGKEEVRFLQSLHQVHLLALISRLRWGCAQSCDPVVQGVMLSWLPLELHTPRLPAPSLSTVSSLMRWFTFRFEATNPYGGPADPAAPVTLLSCLTQATRALQAQVTAFQSACLFTAMCFALGMRARVVAPLSPVPVAKFAGSLSMRGTVLQRCESAPIVTDNRKRKRLTHNGSVGNSAAAAGSSETTDAVLVSEDVLTGSVVPSGFNPLDVHWVEVLCETDADAVNVMDRFRWVQFDPVHGVVDEHRTHPRAKRWFRGSLAYVVACGEHCTLTDVSARYAEKWSAVMTQRSTNGSTSWWESVMKLRPVAPLSGCEEVIDLTDDNSVDPAIVMNCMGVLIDQRELQEWKESEVLPKSLTAFKTHPKYCLESQLGQNQVIWPRSDPVGEFNGEPVYNRSNIQTVHRVDAWRRLGMEVIPEEVDAPAKRVKRRFARRRENSLLAVDSGPPAATVGLYGEWQTRPYTRPVITDGVIPKNEHGNIEIWHPVHVPIGAVHVSGSARLARMAESLGIEHAPAVVGFQHNDSGFAVPVMDGVVVLEGMEGPLLEAFEVSEQCRVERSISVHSEKVLARWRRLVRALMLKQRLKQTYGQSGGTSTNAPDTPKLADLVQSTRPKE